jgi:NAD dependent epimerase/dehydratase
LKIGDQRVLVTGADGFIGSHLVETLVARGAQVRALALYNSFGTWGWLDHLDSVRDIEVVLGDVRDPFFCRSLTRDVDVVFNLAALIAIPYSYTAPASYVATNVEGALNICQACLENNVQRVLQVSTSEVYGTARYVPIDENHPLRAQSPYSATKISADAIAMSYYHAFQLPVLLARPFNTYGPRQSARAVIPTIIVQMASGLKRIRLGNLAATRDLNYVLDTCRAIAALSECDAAVGQVVNIGSNSEVSIGQLFAMIKELMHSDSTPEVDAERIRPTGSEVERLWCDNRKLKQLTGYEPAFDLDAGLRLTIEWLTRSDNLERYKPGIYNV